jgi:hypothetical protein
MKKGEFTEEVQRAIGQKTGKRDEQGKLFVGIQLPGAGDGRGA